MSESVKVLLNLIAWTPFCRMHFTTLSDRGFMDSADLRILDLLQEDATRAISDIAAHVHLSTTACWKRIQKLEDSGVIRQRVTLLDGTKLRVGVTVFVAIKTNQHNAEWLDRFHSAVTAIPEVVEFYRMSGDVDYLLRVV